MTNQPHPLRIQRSRKKGFKLPPDAVVVGRPWIYGNPWTGPDAFEAYKRFIEQVLSGVLWLREIENGLNIELVAKYPIDHWKELRARIMAKDGPLRGKQLACWCGPRTKCHGDILAEAANR